MGLLIPADFAAEVSILLQLADDPGEIQTTTDYGRLAVVVPDYVLERYEQYRSLSDSSSEEPKKKGSRK